MTKAFLIAVVALLLGASNLGAQDRSPVCSVLVANQTTASGMAISPGSTVYSGEILRVSDGGQLWAQCKTVRLALIDNGAMRVFQSNATTVVELERGDLVYSSTGPSQELVFYSLDVRIAPNTAEAFQGRIHAVSDCELSVVSEKGLVTITSGKETRSLRESKAYRVTPVLGVHYKDSWQPTLPDYPELPHDAPYHQSHTHTTCPAAAIQDPATHSLFYDIAPPAAFATGAAIGYHFIAESPSKP